MRLRKPGRPFVDPFLGPVRNEPYNCIVEREIAATGPDTHVGLLVSTLQGSTETTFYVLAVYFGAIQVRRVRHTLAAALSADVAGVIAAVFIVGWLFL